jgi:two-component system phosphate regulon sensor histidine kinase PhoR
MKVQTKLTLLLITLSLCVIAGSGIFSTISLDTYFHDRLINELTTQTDQAEFVIRTLAELDSAKYSRLQQYAKSANLRMTLIDSKGKVIFESDLPLDQLVSVENHKDRPEVQQAIRYGTGTSTRHSATLNIEMLYFAKKILHPFSQATGFMGASVIRIGVPLTHVNEIMNDIRSKILIVSVLILIIVVGITVIVSKRIARPIKEMARIAVEIQSGNLDKRIDVRSGDEFGKLAESLNNMVDKLNQDITKLKKLEHMRSEFLGNVSHELRTPIFAVQGMLETLLQGALDDKNVNHDFIQRALGNTQRLNTLLGDLIEISRIESGDMKMSFRYFEINEFLKSVVGEFNNSNATLQIPIAIEIQSKPTEVYGDKERLRQALVNLIDNALKYNMPGGRVKVKYEILDSSVRIIVEDSGVGIAEEHLPRIFERFYRVDKERSREAGGTGLGLAIVKHIIEAHGSKVEVQSEVGKGSVFSFILKS